MYAHSVLCLDGATLTATGMQRYTAPFEDGTLVTGGNVNAFYSGDARTGYDAITIKNQSNIDFSDNSGGGFAINNVNIHVNDSTINVSNNLGNSHAYTMNTDDEQNPYEIWTELLPNRDWSELEKEWSDANDGAGSGEVV